MIGYLPQQTIVQRDFPASVWEVVLSGCLNRRGMRPFYSPAERRIASANIEKLGIGGLVKKSYRDLSGGRSSGCCSRAPSAPPKSCCCSTSR